MGNFERLSVLVIVVIIVMILVVAIYEWSGVPAPAPVAAATGSKGEECELVSPPAEARVTPAYVPSPSDPLTESLGLPPPVLMSEEDLPRAIVEATRSSLMPSQYIQLRVKDLAVGESGWIDKHDIAVTREGKMALWPKEPALAKPDNPTDLRVMRLETGFQLDVSTCPENERTWTVSDELIEEWFPVIQLIDLPVPESAAGAR